MTKPVDSLRWNLTAKFVLGTLSGLAMLSLLFLLLFTSVYRGAIEREKMDAADQVSSLLETTLKQAMLARDLERLQKIIEKVAESPEVHSMWILNPAGEIRFTSNPQAFGRKFDKNLDPGCRECHQNNSPATTLLFTDTDGQEILRAIKPVANQPECGECHPPVSQQPINGVLVVDYDGSSIQGQARTAAMALVSAGIVVFIITVTGGSWFMRRYVLKPVSQLHEASQDISRGKLETRVEIVGNDEFSELGECFNDMTTQLRAQIRSLQEKDEFLRALVDAIPDGLRVIDTEYGIRLTNLAYRKQLALSGDDTPGTPCYVSSHRRDTPCATTLVRCPLNELKNDGEPFKSIHRHLRPDGHHLDVEVFAAPMEVQVDGEQKRFVVESIRDLKEQVRFSHEQKLSELGQLAAGVAHEIFNPLSAAKMKLDATLAAIEEGRLDTAQVVQAIQVVDAEIARGLETADRLLKLSRYAGNTPTLVDVIKAVSETLSLLNQEATERNIRLEQEHPASRLRTLANESELRLAVLNLAQNAFAAMPEGGTLKVTTGTSEGWIQIVLEDNGVGIREDILPHIFEPFFSRRASDTARGAGLGLAISRANIERIGGRIAVTSTPGVGSRFTISLPNRDDGTQS